MSRFSEGQDVLSALLSRKLQVVGEPLVDHHERCVLEVIGPDGTRAYLKADTVPDRANAEALVLLAAGEAGLPVPRVLDFESGPPSVLVLERVDGDWLSSRRPERAWAATGAALRHLHQLDVPGLRTFGGAPSWGEALTQWVDGARPSALALGVDGRVLGRVATAVDRLRATTDQPDPATLHGDCAPIHVRLDDYDQVTGMLDFGDTGRGDPVFDLAVLTLRAPARLRAVLQGYEPDEATRRWMARALPIYRALRFLGEACWLAEHGFSPKEAIARLLNEAASGSVA
jgi:aminoglycoside phosphotransferase (APT) family kinase protein